MVMYGHDWCKNFGLISQFIIEDYFEQFIYIVFIRKDTAKTKNDVKDIFVTFCTSSNIIMHRCGLRTYPLLLVRIVFVHYS